MMVYQYASHYKELTVRYQEAFLKAEECLGKMEDLLD